MVLLAESGGKFMNFENAKKGLKQLYFGEIFELLSAIAMGVMGFAGNMAQGLKEGANYDKAMSVAAIMLVAAMILTAVASLLKVLGIFKSSQDHKSFGSALIFVLINLIISLMSSVLKKWGVSEDTMNLVKGICNTFTMLFVLQGIIALAGKISNAEVEKTGKRAIWYVLAVEVCARAVSILSRFITSKSDLFWIPAVISVVTMILYIISYLVYLKSIRKGAKML